MFFRCHFACDEVLGSARLSRTGDGVLASADFSYALEQNPVTKWLESSFRRNAETRSPRRPLPNYRATGRGGGVGRPLGIMLGLGVGVALGVAVGVAVAVGDGGG